MPTKEEIKKRNSEAMQRHRLKPGIKEKERQYRIEYSKRPEVKERHRLKMIEYRKKHPEKTRQVSRNSYKKNGHKYNECKRIKYKSDPNYRKQKIDAEKRYKATGRRKELRVQQAPKLRKKSAEWNKKNKEWVKKYRAKYVKNVWNPHEKKQRENLDRAYVIKILRKEMDYVVKSSEIPEDLIELRRLQIKTRRKLKQKI